MDNNNKPLCKSVFKCDGSPKEISSSLTSKWIELINHIEKNKSIRLKNDLHFQSNAV
ncbi:MAG: hypothetical protein J6A30_03920 [Ruminococcus sp.]|nr:hypothetical protein [Ruminococcus sp.]